MCVLQRTVAPHQSCLDWAPVSSFAPRTIMDYVPRYLLTYKVSVLICNQFVHLILQCFGHCVNSVTIILLWHLFWFILAVMCQIITIKLLINTEMPPVFIRTRTSTPRRLIETRRLLETRCLLEHWPRAPCIYYCHFFQWYLFMLILLFVC